MKILKFELEELLNEIKFQRAHVKTNEENAFLMNAQATVLIGLQKYEDDKSVKQIKKELGTF